MAETCLLAMWCPVYKWRDSISGLGVALGNYSCNVKSKPYKCIPGRGKVSMYVKGADHPVVVLKFL